jgi:hypothetical protein
MTFSEPQIKLLSSKLNGKHVRTRELRGRTLSYVEGWHVIAEANRIFGFDSWDRETLSAECVWSEAKREPKMCAYAARVRIRVRAGETIVCREGSGVGHGIGSTLGEAHESALKEAETDAMKRAFATFGNLFGLALYDKEQNGVRRLPAKPVGLRAIEWILRSASGECASTHRKPEAFCTAVREVVTSASSLEDLNAIWARNTDTISQMRIVCPELQTASGVHYADVLEKLYRQQCEVLEPGADSSPAREAVETPLESPAHPIPSPKRLRDDAHLRFVASLPCLVCGRMPTKRIIFASPSRGRWDGRSATNGPCRYAFFITAPSTMSETRRAGGGNTALLPRRSPVNSGPADVMPDRMSSCSTRLEKMPYSTVHEIQRGESHSPM